jgi:hypothetical protein
MTIMPFMNERARSSSAPLEQVAGRVTADVARVRGEVEHLVATAEDDLDLLDRAVVPLETVVDPAAHDPRAELGERPVERRRLADPGEVVLERDDPARKVLEAGDGQGCTPCQRNLHRAGEEGLRHGLPGRAGDLGAGGQLLLDERGAGILAERDDRPGDERTTRPARRPADDDRVLEPDPVRHAEQDSLAP